MFTWKTVCPPPPFFRYFSLFFLLSQMTLDASIHCTSIHFLSHKQERDHMNISNTNQADIQRKVGKRLQKGSFSFARVLLYFPARPSEKAFHFLNVSPAALHRWRSVVWRIAVSSCRGVNASLPPSVGSNGVFDFTPTFTRLWCAATRRVRLAFEKHNTHSIQQRPLWGWAAHPL